MPIDQRYLTKAVNSLILIMIFFSCFEKSFAQILNADAFGQRSSKGKAFVGELSVGFNLAKEKDTIKISRFLNFIIKYSSFYDSHPSVPIDKFFFNLDNSLAINF